jgi:hypothetical protein
MGIIGKVLKLLGFPTFPEKGQEKMYHDNTTFNQDVKIAGDLINQQNAFTLGQKVICGNLWMLKNPFERSPIIPNIFGSFGIIAGWSGVFVTGVTQVLGSKITNGADVDLGALDVSYSALGNELNGVRADVLPKTFTITPEDSKAAANGKLTGGWTINGLPVSGEPDATSDIRLKHNIEPFNDGLNIVLNLNPVRFDWREDKCPTLFLNEYREPDDEYGYPGKIKRQYGLIAQEAEQVVPDIVGERKMYDETYKLIRYEKIVPILISAVQEQQQQIEDLKKQIDALKENNK